LVDAAKHYAAERLGQFVARLLRQSMPFHRDTADYEPRSLLTFLNNIVRHSVITPSPINYCRPS
jgi:hypothetical protein